MDCPLPPTHFILYNNFCSKWLYYMRVFYVFFFLLHLNLLAFLLPCRCFRPLNVCPAVSCLETLDDNVINDDAICFHSCSQVVNSMGSLPGWPLSKHDCNSLLHCIVSGSKGRDEKRKSTWQQTHFFMITTHDDHFRSYLREKNGF